MGPDIYMAAIFTFSKSSFSLVHHALRTQSPKGSPIAAASTALAKLFELTKEELPEGLGVSIALLESIRWTSMRDEVVVSLKSRGEIMRKTLISSLITAVFVGLMAPSSAMAARDATTFVGKLCEVQATPEYFIDQLGNTPSTSELSTTSCNLTASGTTFYNGEYVNTYAHAEGSASAGFGNLPQIGLTSAGASTVSTYGDASAGFSSGVQFFLEIQPIGTLPGTAPSLIPILLSATGSGYAEASNDRSLATTLGIVDIAGWQLPSGREFSFEYRNVSDGRQDASFNGSVSIDLYTGLEYGVQVEAACSTASLGSATGTSASCSAWVDPLVAFDQAAFDQQMGIDTFALNEYYQFVFSPNVPVPEPETYAMLLAGLGLVGAAARRRKQAMA